MKVLRWFAVFAVAASAFTAAISARAATTYMKATLDTLPGLSGSGLAPPVTSQWPPQGVVSEIGTVRIAYNPFPDADVVYVDPTAGLAGSTQGLRFRTSGAVPGLIFADFVADPSLTEPTASAPYWVEARFRIDPSVTPPGNTAVTIQLYDASQRAIVHANFGPEGSDRHMQYLVYTSGVPGYGYADVDPIGPDDEWRVMIKVDPVAKTQTHWLSKNGKSVSASILGTPLDLPHPENPADTFNFMRVVSIYAADQDMIVDEVVCTDSGTTTLKAVPDGTPEVRLTWNDGVSGELGWHVERSTDGNTGWTTEANLGANSTSWTDSGGVVAGTRYFYRVAPFDASGDVAWSNTASAVAVYSGPPLYGWLNLKQAIGTCPAAMGDGTTDDTHAVQCHIDRLGSLYDYSAPHVLWVPSGIYRLTKTVFMEAKVGASIVGERCESCEVRFAWGGQPAAGGPSAERTVAMFHAEGVSDTSFRNIVWDAGSTGRSDYVVAFDESYCGVSESEPPAAPTGNYNYLCDELQREDAAPLRRSAGFADSSSAHYDSKFWNAYIGLRVGHYHVQNSELTVRRCTFDSNRYGVSVEDFNALDIWIWDSAFSSNDIAISNTIGTVPADESGSPYHGFQTDPVGSWAGDFKVVRGRFVGNTTRDVEYAPTGAFTIRDSWSTGSGQFVRGFGPAGTSVALSLINNRVDDFDPQRINGGYAIQQAYPGPVILIGNEIDSDGRPGPAISVYGGVFAGLPAGADILAAHNGYTVSSPYVLFGPNNPKVRAIDDRVMPSFTLAVPSLPTVQDPLLGRPVYTVTDVASIPDVIAAADADPAPAVVHFPDGDYWIHDTIAIGANSRLLVTGNGGSTRLAWGGPPGGLIMDVDGHGARGLVLRDFLAHGLGNNAHGSGTRDARGIRIRDANRAGGHVYISELNVSGSSWEGPPGWTDPTIGAAILVDEIDQTTLDIVDTMLVGSIAHGDLPRSLGLVVKAGPQPQTPKSVWSGLFNGNEWNTWIENGPSGVKVLESNTYSERRRMDADPRIHHEQPRRARGHLRLRRDDTRKYDDRRTD